MIWILFIFISCTYSSDLNCIFHSSGFVYNLTRWHGRTIYAEGLGQSKGSHYNISICGNLSHRCRDSMMGILLPPGAIFSMYRNEKPGTCWDILAHWEDLKSFGQNIAHEEIYEKSNT